MSFDNFYYLFRDSEGPTKYWWAAELDRFKSIDPDEKAKIIRGEQILESPIEMKLGGGKASDFIAGSFRFLVGRRVIDMLTAYKLTGWKTFPVRVLSKKNEHIVDIYGLSILGRAVHIPMKDWKRGDGWKFDLESWDHSDFFVLSNSDAPIVTERVVEVFKKESITGVNWQPLSTV